MSPTNSNHLCKCLLSLLINEFLLQLPPSIFSQHLIREKKQNKTKKEINIWPTDTFVCFLNSSFWGFFYRKLGNDRHTSSNYFKEQLGQFLKMCLTGEN